jgi:hypothetical protein
MCLSRCLSCLPHYPLDPLCLGLFPLLQCLSSPPLPLSFSQTRPDRQKSKDKTEQDQPRLDPTKQAQTLVSQPCRLDSRCASHFACPTRYDDLASFSDDEDEPSSPVCSQLSMPADPFSALRAPPPPSLSRHFVSRTTLMVCPSLSPCLSCRLSPILPSLSLHLLPPY